MLFVSPNRYLQRFQLWANWKRECWNPFCHRENRTADQAHKITLQAQPVKNQRSHERASQNSHEGQCNSAHEGATQNSHEGQCNNSSQGCNTTQPQGGCNTATREKYNAAHEGVTQHSPRRSTTKAVTHQAVSKQNRPARTTRVDRGELKARRREEDWIVLETSQLIFPNAWRGDSHVIP